MLHDLRALVVGDDPGSRRRFASIVEGSFPDLLVSNGAPDRAFDEEYEVLILVGNVAEPAIARTLRAENLDALIVAATDELDPVALRSLVNAGCNGLVHIDGSDAIALIDLVRAHLARTETGADGVLGAVRSVSELLHRWRLRLHDVERGRAT